MYKVHTPFPDPRILADLQKAPYCLEARVINNNLIECCGERYSLVDDAVNLISGEPVWLLIHGGFFHVETKEEHEQRILKRLASQWSKRQESER